MEKLVFKSNPSANVQRSPAKEGNSVNSNQKQLLCYTIITEGHYQDWERALTTLTECIVIMGFWQQLRMLFTRSNIIYLDADQKHLIFTPLMVLRELWGGKNFLISIRTEYLILHTLKGAVKRRIYAALKKYTSTRIISIHKGVHSGQYDKYITDYIYDLQYWDLPLIEVEYRQPLELEGWKSTKPVVIFFGAFNDKKSRSELLEFLTSQDTLNFTLIFAGRIQPEDMGIILLHKDCLALNRYIDNNEMFYLYSMADTIYCYYSRDTNRPSGLFGRAVQLKKHVIVRKNGFLHRTNRDYGGLIPVDNLEDFNRKCTSGLKEVTGVHQFDDSKTLLKILGSD